jgi:hypothetical protein
VELSRATWGGHPSSTARLREDAQGIAGSIEKNFLGDRDERQTGFDLLILALGKT